jgi:hypothetical protein
MITGNAIAEFGSPRTLMCHDISSAFNQMVEMVEKTKWSRKRNINRDPMFVTSARPFFCCEN